MGLGWGVIKITPTLTPTPMPDSWYLQESNQGHTDFQSVALPTELRYHPKINEIIFD